MIITIIISNTRTHIALSKAQCCMPTYLLYLEESEHVFNRSSLYFFQEIASMLIAFDRHQDWLSKEVKIRYKKRANLIAQGEKTNKTA